MIDKAPLRWTAFLMGGALNTGISYLLFLILQIYLHYQVAYGIAYAFGVVISYWYNANFVFQVPPSWIGLFYYPIVYVVQYVASALLLSTLVEALDMPAQLAPLLVTGVMIPATYVMTRHVLRWSHAPGKTNTKGKLLSNDSRER